MTAATLVMCSILLPARGWFAPDQPWTVNIKPPAGQTITVMLNEFTGQSVGPDAKFQRDFARDGSADLKQLFPAINAPGTYLLYAVPQGARSTTNFIGTPLVITVREDRRRGAPLGPMVVRMEPLRYAIISTDAGDMTMGFYFDVAPNSISNFISLAQEKFYDGLTFHRIESDFVIQGGDPRHDGTGGPGYSIDAEFSERKHGPGVVSMARNMDPNESPANPPRPEFANSAGSQFFICLDSKNTAQLNGQFTVFGRVVGPASLKTLAALGSVPLADKKSGRPVTPPVIKKIEICPVLPRQNPYDALIVADEAADDAPAAPTTKPEAKGPEKKE